MRISARGCLVVLAVAALAGDAAAQSMEVVGTRAQGMGGAFVGVADDASAVYWNPAGLARGAFFSLVLDRATADKAEPSAAGRREGWLLALTTPALGLSYYRLERTAAVPGGPGATEPFRLESLVTQHVGATVVQSLTDTLAVGATVKYVRGIAGAVGVPALSPEDAVEGFDVLGRSGSAFDVDLGVMASGSLGRIGLLVRNVTEPGFETAGGGELSLDRQVRAGASLLLLQDWMLAADLDLTSSPSPLGDVREFASGVEGRLTRRLSARAGLRLNAAGDADREPALSVGASYAVFGSLQLDGQYTGGAARAFTGWGLAGRLVF